ncbi:MAG: ATP-binding protein, partial [Chloroflexota bacterium]|nr:ATP-binding protein [Chloroflexota bacterium]
TSMFLRTMSEYRISERTASISLNISLVNNALAEYLGRYRIPLAVQDAQHDLRLESIRHLMFEGGIKSLLVVPLFVRQRLTGIVAVTKAETYEFSGEELTLAGALAQAVSQALENSLLHTSTTEQNNNLEQIVMARTAQLQRLNERMSAVLNNTSDAIVLVETNKIIENTNFAFDQMFGYGHDEMFGHSIDNLAHPDHQKHLFEAFRRVLQSHQTQQKQLVGVRKDGSVFDMDCTLVYVHDNEGHIVLTARDITHLKEVERMKDHFVSMVSHELKNPLNGIMVGASNLKNYYVKMDDDQCMGAIDRLNSGALAMAELIKGILNLARIDAGSLVRTEERIAMRPIVEKVIAELQAESEAKHQTISLNMDFAPDVLIGDSLDFTRIWHNLIGNASKYTPDGGKISVRLGTLSISAQSRPIVSENIQLESLKLPADMIAGDYLLCQIEDDGYGISSADLKQLFTRFFRGAAATGDIPGTGLGLALVRELLRFYGGEISVVSELTVGSCFSFWIKLEGIDVVV